MDTPGGVLFMRIMKNILLLLTLVPTLAPTLARQAPSHKIWDQLLQKHVTTDGKVNYTGFIQNKAELRRYLDLLAANPPENHWKKDEKQAYWINAYNAFTVKLIVDNYPVKSIRALGGKVYKINTPWAKKWIKLGHQVYSLDDIEHGILRKIWKEPRVHFALNCASFSCPRLRNEAYMADKLNVQLDDQAFFFINNKAKNTIYSSKEAQLSKIFSWFKGDFTQKGNLIDFINAYAIVKLDEDAKITPLDYNWDLNE